MTFSVCECNRIYLNNNVNIPCQYVTLETIFLCMFEGSRWKDAYYMYPVNTATQLTVISYGIMSKMDTYLTYYATTLILMKWNE